ncbi:MAG: hypothetical protein SFY69_13300 [Planctomycetota bacterium]|nr:hypothetical protein [Planctomycetota bacterium]
MTGARPVRLNHLRWRTHIVRTVVAGVVASGAWLVLVRPQQEQTADRRATLRAAAAEIDLYESGELGESELRPLVSSLSARLDAIYRWATPSGDAGKLYESLRSLASGCGVRLQRIEPSGARQTTRRPAPGEPAAESVAYSVEVIGKYESIARFIDACATRLGASRVAGARMLATGPTQPGEEPVLTATIDTVHLKLRPPASAEDRP